MKKETIYPEWRNKPFKLTPEEIEEPYQVIEDFFSYGHLSEIRENLWEWLKTTVTGDYNEGLENTDRNRLLFFYEQLEKFIEGVHVLHEQRNSVPEEELSFADDGPPEEINDPLGEEEEDPDDPDDPLDRIVRIITNAVDTEKIFLLGAWDEHTNDPESPAEFELLLLVGNNTVQPLYECRDQLEANCRKIASVHITIYKANEVYPLLEKGHIFFSTACKKDHLLYDNGIHALPVASGRIPVASIAAKAREDFSSRFSKAAAFLKGARYYQGKKENELAAFMLQQAAEHTFRAVIAALGGYRLVTHNLSRLMRNCARFDRELTRVFPQNTEEDLRLFGLLQKAYVHARYRDNFEMDDEDLLKMTDRVTVLQSSVQKIVEEKITAFEQ